MPVLIHFGMLGAGGGISWNERDNPGALERVARDFPTIQFVIPHFGIQYVKELLFLCWACDNVNVDTSGSNQWVRWMPYPLTLDDLLRKFHETVGPDRILFGSDSSWFPRGFSIRYLQDQIRACRFMNFPNEALRKSSLRGPSGGDAQGHSATDRLRGGAACVRVRTSSTRLSVHPVEEAAPIRGPIEAEPQRWLRGAGRSVREVVDD